MLLLSIVHSQIYDCQIQQGECSDNYDPVCGLNISNSSIQTFVNNCFACKASQVVKYIKGDCQKKQDDTKIDVPQTSAGVDKNPPKPTSGNYTQTISCTNPRPSICDTSIKSICGLFDSTTKCTGQNCLQQFTNECLACRNTSIHSYFFGNCSEYKPQSPTIIQCNSQSSNNCELKEQLTVCGFLDETAICQNPPCLQPFDNKCEPCQQSNITSYFVGDCNQYQELFYNAEQKSDSFVANYQYCQAQRPSECDQEYVQTCGILKSCNGNGCERNYDNSCSACQNSDIEGYYTGECLNNYMKLISIMFIIALLIQ
ncbi:unnamed protein product [Paramecium pentaurelia]|uniref:Kazal-like domain-containing protein n=1 Tax=Paramecium pentaurelia TaxID=43138 RepID=A0A8S1S0F1_9CILI|nr:unnamed protein product [Paramecium pentaurelia]